MYCVYGPPIKKKYKCKKCNHKWYTAALGGGKDSLYCPQCGEKQIELTETKYLDFGDDPDADESGRKTWFCSHFTLFLLSERSTNENIIMKTLKSGLK